MSAPSEVADVEMEIEDHVPVTTAAFSSASSLSSRPGSSTLSGTASATRELTADELNAKRLVEKREEKRRLKGQQQQQKETQEAEKRERLFTVEDRRKEIQQQQQKDKKQDWFLAKLKYRNALPDIPFDPKLLQYPFDPLRFVRYIPTTLEKKFKFDMRPEPDLGIHVDLIDIGRYDREVAQEGQLTEDDNQLLAKYDGPKAGKKEEKAGRATAMEPWLRRTEYISGTVQRFQGRDVVEG